MKTLDQLLAASAESRGDAPALIDGDRSLSYGELEARAGRLAGLLAELGVARGDRVGIYLDKSIEAIVAVYGVLRAGASYVPLDPQAPPKRLGYVLADADIRVLLTGAEKEDLWEPLVAADAPLESLVVLNAASGPSPPKGVRLLTSSDIADAHHSARSLTAATDQDLAYVLYTSGSTGTPKGVMLSHRNCLAFVEWAVAEFAVSAEDRLSNHAPLHFDLSTFDLFAAAHAGASLVLIPPETSVFPGALRRAIGDSEITIWYSVPSILTMLAVRGGLAVGDLPRLRCMLFAGEVFPTRFLRQLMSLLPHVRFANLYGPTETNVCTWYDVPMLPEEMTAPIPIGKGITGVEVFAVTDSGQQAARGEVGELYVRGPTVMQGYWGDHDRTARSLVLDPRDGASPENVYRTGDLVQEQEDGNFRFLGRRDAQIKSRGYRIELGEIESALYAHPAVDECAVVPIPDDRVTNRIKAYVAPHDGASKSELVAFCAERLPRYMIPELFEFREVLPKTSTGKVDRRALGVESP
jgi:amino acid adenylation domain-containing protein